MDVKDMQSRLEDIAFKLRIPQRKPWQGMSDNVQASLVLAQQPDKVHSLLPDKVHSWQQDKALLQTKGSCSSQTRYTHCIQTNYYTDAR